MLTEKRSGGFTLYGIMISITIMGIIISLFPMLDRAEFINRTDLLKNTLRLARLLVLTQHKPHRVKN